MWRDRLGPSATEYIARSSYDKSKLRHLLGRFHAWLEVSNIAPSSITTDLVDEFIKLPWARELAASTTKIYSNHLYRYVWWLGTRGHVPPPERRTKNAVASLPDVAQAFVNEFKTTLAPGTVQLYEVVLRNWYQWAQQNDINSLELARSDAVAYCMALHRRGLAPQTRALYLSKLRRYLYYLADEGLLHDDPTKLIRPEDFPKPPSLLPRALPPDVDAKIRSRLAGAPDVRCHGLLLMRHTGLRVSELANLKYHCLHRDHQGFRYLKVPLGKLKKERLVPLHDDAHALLVKLRDHGRDDRTWLLENPRTNRPFHTARYHESMQAIRDGLHTPDGIAITTHRLRHTFATELLSGGLSLAAIKQLLGHRSLNMTIRYVNLTPDQLYKDYLAANAKARVRYGQVPQASPEIGLENRTAAQTIDDTVRQIKRDAATLTQKQKARARRVTRQLRDVAALLKQLGL